MLLILIGFLVGTLGTLIGVGGGFVLVPTLLFLYPSADPTWISSISIWVVALNATSGSIVYKRQGRVHLKAALAFVAASLPGSILGVWAEHWVDRRTFELIFGVAVILYALLLLFRAPPEVDDKLIHSQSDLRSEFFWKGCVISFFVGFVASFFGIGGGVIHVPLLSHLLGFPVHLATGTSHMILAATSWFTTIVRFIGGDLKISDPTLWQLGIPAVIGAQLGARLSTRVSGRWIMKLLAIALLSVGIRLLLLNVL